MNRLNSAIKSLLMVFVASCVGVTITSNASEAEQTSKDSNQLDAVEDTKKKQLVKINEEKQEEIENLLVITYSGSLKKNLSTKRYADIVVDSISAEDIGKFPDQNVAESLSRVAGVSVDTNFGEGESVSIRGTAPGLNRTLLNGQNVATSDWWALSLGKREFNYTLIPSVMVKQLEVHKSPTADIDEGSIGGTVYMKTRRPLGMDDGSGALSFQEQYSDKSDKWDVQLAGLYSIKNDDETFGALLTVAMQDNTVRRDGLESWGWAQGTFEGNSDIWFPKWVGAGLFTQERERNSGMLSLQWLPRNDLELTFNVLRSKMDANNISQAYMLAVENGLNNGAVPTNIVYDNVNGDTVLAMTVPDSNNGDPSLGSEILFDTRNRKAYFETGHYDLDIEFDGVDYELHAQLGFTEADGGNRSEVATTFYADTAYSFDYTQGVPQVELLDMDVNDLDNYRLRLLSMYDRPQHDDETYGQLDYKYNFDMGIISNIKAGIKYRDHLKSQRANLYSSKTVTDGYDQSYYDELVVEGEATLADFSGAPLDNNFMAGNALPGSMTEFTQLDFLSMEQAAYTNQGRFTPVPLLTAEFDIEEEISATYFRTDFEYDDELRGNFGMRYVSTDLDSSSWVYSGSKLDPAHKEWVTHSRSYSDLLPSLNLSYNVSEEVMIRFAASKVMSRPGYGNLSGYRGLNDTTLTGSGGNPYLDPYRASQFDLSWEWYMEDGGGFSTAIFYKNIESYLTSTEVIESHFHEPSETVQDYLINVKSNGTGGQNVGFELTFQKEIYDGFGVTANYTYSNSSTDSGDLIPGNSENTSNFTTYYEKGKLSARLSYNFRSEYFLMSSRGNDVFVDGSERWDTSITYRLFPGLSMVLQGVNLTNEHKYRYADDVRYRNLAIYENGRKFRLGLRYKF